MAKKKQKKGKADKQGAKAGGAETAMLPKRIAGVKVPKTLRESGGKLLEAVRQPVVLEIAAAALVAAAEGLRQGQANEKGGGAGAKGGNGQGKASADFRAILAATAVEGIRRISAANSGKGDGAKKDS